MTDKTLKDLLLEGVERFNDSNKPIEIIDNAIEKLFKDSIDSEFRSYGDFGKMVQGAVRKALPANIQDVISLTKYNKLVVDTLQKQWLSSGIQQDFINKATSALDEITKEQSIPEYVYLSDLFDAFIEEHKEEAMEDGWERPDIRIENADYDSKFIHIYFDKRPEKNASSSYLSSKKENKYSLDNNLACKDLNEKVKSKCSYDTDEYAVYKVYSARFKGECMGKLLQTNCSQFERLMVALYCNSSKLVIDCNEDDIYYPNKYE